MSLILDALKRAERERQVEATSPLGELAPAGRARPRRRWGRWVALALLVGVGALVTTGVLKKRARPGPPAAASSTPARPTPPAAPRPAPNPPPPAAQAAPVPAPATNSPPAIQARPAPPVVPGTEGVASLDDLTQESDIVLVPAAPAPAPAAPAEQRPELMAEPQPAPEEPAEVVAEAPMPPAPSTPAEPPPRAIPPALTQQAPTRKLREMPPEYRADFPALTVEVHVFEPNRRFVMINGRRYREGERLAEGPQLVQVVRDGVVLEFRGERVLYPLGR